MIKPSQSEVFSYVEKLGRFFVWRRKYFAQLLAALLAKAQEAYAELQKQHEVVNQNLEVTQVDLLTTQQDLDQKQQELLHVQQSLHINEQRLEQTRQQLDASQQQFQQARQKLQATQQQVEQVQFALKSTQEDLKKTQEDLLTNQQSLKSTKYELSCAHHYLDRRQKQLNHTQQKLVATCGELNASQYSLQQTQDVLTAKVEYVTWADKELETLREIVEDGYKNLQSIESKNRLIADLLSTKKPSNEGLLKFTELLQCDYMDFVSNDTSQADKHTTLLMLKSIEQELELLIGFPEIYSKKNIAISGGFSSGKSEFVNSFIDDNFVKLAVGIQPMTAIPSYVISTKSTVIQGYSANGGCINLDASTYQQVSHEFIKDLGFDLKKIMPFMSIGVSMDNEIFSDLCLIDTPGYNPSKTGSTDEDANTASHYVSQSDALIWVIGLDSNGTISTSDLDFIKSLDLGEKPIFFVLNKADLRAANDIQDIIEEVRDILVDEDIQYCGICSYSSFSKESHFYEEIQLHEFLKKMNTSPSVHHDLCVRIDQIFDAYSEKINQDIDLRKLISLKMKSVRLDILEANNQSLYQRTEERFRDMAPIFDFSKLQSSLIQLNQLRNDFKKSILQTMDAC